MADHFDHDKLEVYKLILEFVALAEHYARRIRPTHPDLARQLTRAADSLGLNTCEGAGEYSRREKAHFYRIARRSGTESAGALDLACARGIVTREDVAAGRTLLIRIVSMLIKMAKGFEKGLDGQDTHAA